MIVRVGSTRPAKVEGARAALQAVARVHPQFQNFSIEAHDLTSIAPSMPMSVDEIIGGAVARASAVAPNAGDERGTAVLAIGLEGGLHRVRDSLWSLQSWAAVTDGARWSYGAGPVLILPTGVVERVHAGEELGDIIDRIVGEPVRGTRGAWGVLTHDLIGRQDAFRLAVLAALAPFYNARAWGG